MSSLRTLPAVAALLVALCPPTASAAWTVRPPLSTVDGIATSSAASRRTVGIFAAADPTPQPQRGALRARIIGIGAAAPPTKITNAQLEAVVDTSDEWIAQRTGIRSRHLLQPGEGLTELASKAMEKALENAGVPA